MPTPAQKIRVIEESLRCFAFSLLSLIPLVGLPFAILTIVRHRKIRAAEDGEWNPAQLYLAWGFCLAWLGGCISFVALAAFGIALGRLYDFW